jgi:putative ABC transport system permease protein
MVEWLTHLRVRIRAILRRTPLEQDLEDEIAFHLAMREEQLRGVGAEDPGAAARRRFGSVARIREELRDTWAIAPGIGALAADVRYAARRLRRSPGFTLVVVLTLGLGIGTTTAFFSAVYAVLLRPLGYADPDRLMLVYETFPQAGIERLPFSPLDFEDFRRYQGSFEAAAAYRSGPFELSGSGEPERILGAKVSADLFRVLGVWPIAGRAFAPSDDVPGVNVAILSWRLWQRRYGGASTALGTVIWLDRQPYTVVGVMPPGFAFPGRGPRFNADPAEVWVPIAFTPRERAERGAMYGNSVIARLEAGMSPETARADLDLTASRIAVNYPAIVRDAGFLPRLVARPLREEISGRVQAPLLSLLAAVVLVLVVACANVANLMSSRLVGRTGEFAVRIALGARPRRVVQLLLCEALLLSVFGGLVGTSLAYAATRAVPAVLARTIPGLQDIAIDIRVLAVTALICMGTAVTFTMLCLQVLRRRAPANALREGTSRLTGASRSLRMQRAFVVATMSIACMLLAGAGLFVKSFAALMSTDIGFQPARVLTASLALPPAFYATAEKVRTFHDALARSLSPLPGVRSVTIGTDLPLTTYETRGFTPEGGIAADVLPVTSLTWVDGPYFETLGIPLTIGRSFDADEYAQNRRVVIVNEKLARSAWPGANAVGKRLKWGGKASPNPWLTVVGVIRDVVDGPIGTPPGLHAYEPFRQLPDVLLDGAENRFGRGIEVAVRVDGDPRALAALVRTEIRKLDPRLAIESIESMDALIQSAVAPQRASTQLVTAFAALALVLAVVGVYGLLAFTTSQRQKEIAVRMALGAERRAIVRMVVGQGARLVAIGLAIGTAGAFVLSRALAPLLYSTDPHDVAVFAIVPIVLVPTALIACALPALRVARMDQAAALRAD